MNLNWHEEQLKKCCSFTEYLLPRWEKYGEYFLLFISIFLLLKFLKPTGKYLIHLQRYNSLPSDNVLSMFIPQCDQCLTSNGSPVNRTGWK
jgi:hypothetical protein